MAFDPDKINYFAKTDARGSSVSFGIKAKDRQRHMYVIGKTGMGKSTLLENMAAQDIMNGEGMAFIDPHGSAAEVLLEYIPEHRVNDVVYFAPFDMENPIAFNVMEDVGADKRHLVVSGLMSTFKKIWVDAWSARMEYILTNALLALIEYPDTTLLSVNRMLADKKYRDQVVDHIKDPAVKAYWVDEFANYTERFAADALPAIQNKIGQFTGNPLIRNIIGQTKSSFDIREMMDNKKILIVNLSKGLVGETNANLLGSMLTTRIYLAAMSRADIPVAQMKDMPNFYFYVDEFQSFANATFANILSEARKYHLNLIIAHQYIEQMEEDVRNAVFGNVGTTITFRVGPYDAEHLEKIFEPKFMATDLVNLGQYQIYLTLMIDGIGSQPFSAVTLPSLDKPHVSYKEMAIAASRRNFTGKRDVVEAIVNELHNPKERAEASAKGEGGNKGSFSTPAYGKKVGQANGNGNGKKNGERPKPNFENTILDKLREQTKQAEPTKKAEENDSSKPAPAPESKPDPESDPDPIPAAPEKKVESAKPTANFEPKPMEKTQLTPPTLVGDGASGQSLEDLRAILKRISDKEKASPTEDRVRNDRGNKRNRRGRDDRPRREENKFKKDSGPDLKSVLANAVGKKTEQTPSAVGQPQTEKPVTPERVTPRSEVEKPKQSDDEVTTKELERMMRVTSSEKPPL